MPSARNTSLGVGGAIVIGALVGNILTSVLTGKEVPVGSTVTTGNVVLATANKLNATTNAYPSLVVDSGSVKTWIGGNNIPGGGVRLTASGSRDFVANMLVPNTFASGAVLDEISIECNNTERAALSGSLIANQPFLHQSITTGVALRNGLFMSTGSYINANSGATIQQKLTKGTYLSYITINSGSTVIKNGTTPDCIVRPTFSEKYGR